MIWGQAMFKGYGFITSGLAKKTLPVISHNASHHLLAWSTLVNRYEKPGMKPLNNVY